MIQNWDLSRSNERDLNRIGDVYWMSQPPSRQAPLLKSFIKLDITCPSSPKAAFQRGPNLIWGVGCCRGLRSLGPMMAIIEMKTWRKCKNGSLTFTAETWPVEKKKLCHVVCGISHPWYAMTFPNECGNDYSLLHCSLTDVGRYLEWRMPQNGIKLASWSQRSPIRQTLIQRASVTPGRKPLLHLPHFPDGTLHLLKVYLFLHLQVTPETEQLLIMGIKLRTNASSAHDHASSGQRAPRSY